MIIADTFVLHYPSTNTHAFNTPNSHSNPSKMSIASGKLVYYYMTRDTLCFLTLTEESYPKRMAFLYLEEVADIVLQELMQEHGNDVSVF